jgi:membrane protein DedA with SNARE-associated domain
VHFATNVVGDLGLGGIFLLMLAESACIPIPSEGTMLFAGFGVAQGRYSLVAITVAGVLGNLVGSWISYGVGYFGRMELVDRHARKLHIKPQHIAWADRWFARYGEATVFFTRLMPLIRTFISLPAGIGRMPFVRFTVFTLLGCIPWVLLLGFIGQQVGHNWTQWKNGFGYVDYVVIALVVVAIVYLTLRWRARRRASRQPVLRPSADDERYVQASHQDGTDPEHETYLGRSAGHAERSKDSSHRRAASVDEEHPPFEDEQSSPLAGRREPLP